MKRTINIAAALALLASPALGQNLYDTRNFGSTCSQNPYALKGYDPQPIPTTLVFPALFEQYAVRYSIAQGAVGTADAPRAYLNISNLEAVDQAVAVRLTVEGIACPLKWEGTVPANGRVSLGLHGDPTLVGRPWNFSAVVYFELTGGDVELTTYDVNQRETGAKAGKLVPR